MITFYKNITDTKNPHYKELSFALERIKNPNKNVRDLVGKIRASQDAEEIDALKKKLPCVLFGGTFKERKDAELIQHSGVIVLDFDMEDELSAKLTKTEMMQSKHTYAAWISPSGRGVKALFKIKYPEKHREHFKAIQVRYPHVDGSGINVSRVCYESYDEEIYINPNSEVFDDYIEEKKFEVIKEKIEITEAVRDDYEKYKRILTWLENRNDSFVSGQRNLFIFKLAAACCRFGIDMYVAEGFISSDFLGRDSDFTRNEAVKAIESAYKANYHKQGTEYFEDKKIVNRETMIEINPKVLEEGYILPDVIYGDQVWEAAESLYDNGYESAETTHIPKLDEIFKWKKGQITLVSGHANSGKSEFMEAIMLVKSYHNGDKWAVYSPENYPADEWYFTFTERLLGMHLTPENKGRVSKEVFKEAYEFVSQHFFYVYPETLSPTPQNIKAKFLELIITKKVTGVLLDPFNQLINDYGKFNGRDDKYLETALGDFSRFAKENSVFFVIVAHPHKMQIGGDGNYPMPNYFDIAGGAMWANKMDNIIIYHRPMNVTDPMSPICEVETKKVKKQRLFKKGKIEGHFDFFKRRFTFDAFDPLQNNKFMPVETHTTTKVLSSYYEVSKDDGDAPF